MKKFLIVFFTVFTFAAPLQAMEGGDNAKGFISKITDFAKDHPIITVSAGILGAGAVFLSRFVSEHNRNLNLIIASSKGDLATVKRLVGQGADINAFYVMGGTPLYAALGRNQKETVVWLLKNGAKSPYSELDYTDMLMEACEHNNLEKIKLLLSFLPIEPSQSNKESYQRVMAFLCSCKHTEYATLPRDVRLSILTYLPEDITSKEHLRLMMNLGADLKTLVKKCPFIWFKEIYKKSSPENQVIMLEELVPLFAEHQMQDIVSEFESRGYSCAYKEAVKSKLNVFALPFIEENIQEAFNDTN